MGEKAKGGGVGERLVRGNREQPQGRIQEPLGSMTRLPTSAQHLTVYKALPHLFIAFDPLIKPLQLTLLDLLFR